MDCSKCGEPIEQGQRAVIVETISGYYDTLASWLTGSERLEVEAYHQQCWLDEDTQLPEKLCQDGAMAI